MTPNRIAVYLTAAAGLLGGLAPAVANLDLSSTIGIVAGLGAIVAVVRKWLTGWQAFEHRQSLQPAQPPQPVALPPSPAAVRRKPTKRPS